MAVARATPAEKAKPKPVAEEPTAEEEPASEPVFVQVPTLTPGLRAQNKFERRVGQHTIAVVGQGDPTLADAARAAVEEQLRESGATVVDNPGQADVVVRVNAEVLGVAPSFGAGAPAASTAMLSIQAFGAGGRALGPGTRQRIEYTPDDVEGKLSQLVNGSSGRLVELLNRQR
jgi:hypothetical protein